jgi:hypothetical protein
LTVNTNGYAELTLTETNHFFSDLVLWSVFKDGGDITTSVTKVLSNLDKKVTFSNVPFSPGSTYSVVYYYRIYNTADDNFGVGENLLYDDGSGAPAFSAEIFKESAQYLAIHHYEDADGNWVDIDPFTQAIPSGATPVTNLDRLEQRNDDLKQIKVLKTSAVERVVSEFNQLLG